MNDIIQSITQDMEKNRDEIYSTINSIIAEVANGNPKAYSLGVNTALTQVGGLVQTLYRILHAGERG